jgi:hypothetical protein
MCFRLFLLFSDSVSHSIEADGLITVHSIESAARYASFYGTP